MDLTRNLVVNIKADRTPQGQHRGRFNEQKTNEIAVVVSSQEAGSKRDIVVWSKGGAPKNVSEFHPAYDALQYPLIYTAGGDGFAFRDSNKKASTSKQTLQRAG